MDVATNFYISGYEGSEEIGEGYMCCAVTPRGNPPRPLSFEPATYSTKEEDIIGYDADNNAIYDYETLPKVYNCGDASMTYDNPSGIE